MTPMTVEEMREARERIVGNLTDLRKIAKSIGDDFLAYLLESPLREAKASLVRTSFPEGQAPSAAVIPLKRRPKEHQPK